MKRFQSALALALASFGCAAPSSTAPQPSIAHDVDYEIELADARSSALRIQLSTTGDASGATRFALQAWGGVEDPGLDVRDLTARGADGRALEVDHPENSVWVAHHAPNERIDLAYGFAGSNASESLSPTGRSQYRVITRPGLIHFIGNTALLAPVGRAQDARSSIGLTWRGFRAAHWSVASSFAPDDRPFEARLPLDEFRNAVFLAGDLRVVKREVHGAPLYVAIAGDGWKFRDEEFADLAASIVRVEREFFGDFDYPHFLISLIPMGASEDRGFSLGGTGLSQSFAMFMQPNAELDSHSSTGPQVQRVLAHEMFHHWNGGTITLTQPEQRGYWFSEGFTDFYARRILHRGGWLDRDGYVQDLDQRIEHYLLSPVVGASSERIQAEFWTDPEVQRLPYERGDVLAMFVDSRIRAISKGTRSLDDCMRVLVEKSRTRRRAWSVEELIAELRSYTDDATAERVLAIADRGEIAAFDETWFAPCLSLEHEPRGAFELGFDFAGAQLTQRISGVIENSNAFNAGLRDGQEWLGGSIYFGDTEHDAEVTVRDGVAVRTLRYRPVGAARSIPVYRASSDASSRDCIDGEPVAARR